MLNMRVFIIMVLGFITALTALGFYTLTVSGERNVLDQTVKTKEAEIECQKDNVAFYKAWIERNKLDAIKKDEEYNRTMAAKPKYKTIIEYVPTGDNCTDLNALIDEARGNTKVQGESL